MRYVYAQLMHMNISLRVAQHLIDVPITTRFQGYRVHHIYNRAHVDVRNNTQFQQHLEGVSISFCFFLACEVGGSKYIGSENKQAQLDIIEVRSRSLTSLSPLHTLMHQSSYFYLISSIA